MNELNDMLNLYSPGLFILDLFKIGGEYDKREYVLYTLGDDNAYVAIIDNRDGNLDLLPVTDLEEANAIKEAIANREEENG